MSNSVKFSETALSAIIQISEYIADTDPVRARLLRKHTINAGHSLAEFPMKSRVSGTRELLVPRSPYILIYSVSENEIEIDLVIHGKQKWPPEP